MATGSLAPFVRWSGFDNNGDPAAGYKLFTYVAGTTTKQNTYTDISVTAPFANTNPIILDSAGRATIFLLPAASYKFVLAPPTDSDPPVASIWTQDNIDSTPASSGNTDVTGTAGENLTAGDAAYLSQGDGGRTNGAWYKSDSDVDYSTALANVVGFVVNDVTAGNTGSFRVAGLQTGLAGLTAGTTYYASSTPGALSTSGGTYPRRYGVASTTTALVIFPPSRDAGATDAGAVSTIAQTFEGQKDFYVIPRTYVGSQTTNTSRMASTLGSDWSVVTTSVAATPTTLKSYTFPINFIDFNTQNIRCTFVGKYAATANNKTTIIQIGGTTVYTLTTATNDGTWKVVVEIARTSTTNVRVNTLHFISPADTDTSTGATASVSGTGYQTLAVSDLSANTLVVAMVATDTTAAGGTTANGCYFECF